ncbi:basic helix-loop-helix protein 004-like [Andrographis paniculata]|uniref:basic helix-loop-helix protein 004-like n=1 Tax=Andrographis paniculata TaxID=175694 RepID=UPI0021E6D7B1|nr:basic helix-loop-helix protein 004-like [Andrographis paniculata]
MVSREHKRAEAKLRDKLQILQSVTHSRAINDSSIVMDASNYIRELKQKIERLKQEIATSESSSSSSSSVHQNNMWPRVSVETLENGGGFQVNIRCGAERSCPGLLMSILATFEELGLNVLEARVSCAHTFHLQAIGGAGGGPNHNEDDEESIIDAQMVKQAIWDTIKNWSESIDDE